MIRRDRLSMFTVASLVSLTTAGALQMACSSDDSSSAALTPFDSGTVSVPEAGAQAPSSIVVQVQGQGVVASSDAQPVDGGLVGKVVCSAEGPPSQCAAPQHATLYAVPATGWLLSRWTTTGLAANVDLAAGSGSYAVTDETPSPLIVIFEPPGFDAGAPPADAGHD